MTDWLRYGLFREVMPWPERLRLDEVMRQDMKRDEWRNRLVAWCGLEGEALDRACSEAESLIVRLGFDPAWQNVCRRASAGEGF